MLCVSNTCVSNVLARESASASHLPGRQARRSDSDSKWAPILSFITNFDREEFQHRESASASYFYFSWNIYLPFIKCVKSHDLDMCATCVEFRGKQVLIATRQITGVERTVAIKYFKAHIENVMMERAAYRTIRLRAKDDPGEILSIIIDGADQAKFGVPRFRQKSKGEKGYILKQKVTGVLFNSGLGTSYLYCILTSWDNIAGGANQKIDSFCRSMFMVNKRRSMKSSMATFAKYLYVQLDNTAKDNKNRYWFVFCDHLVYLGIFKEIIVNFLPVEHTHEDIDGKFSRHSVCINQRDFITVDDLHEALRSSDKSNKPLILRANGLPNYSRCLKEQACVVSKVDGLSTYRKFVFQRSGRVTQRRNALFGFRKAGHTMIAQEEDLVLL